MGLTQRHQEQRQEQRQELLIRHRHRHHHHHHHHLHHLFPLFLLKLLHFCMKLSFESVIISLFHHIASYCHVNFIYAFTSDPLLNKKNISRGKKIRFLSFNHGLRLEWKRINLRIPSYSGTVYYMMVISYIQSWPKC